MRVAPIVGSVGWWLPVSAVGCFSNWMSRSERVTPSTLGDGSSAVDDTSAAAVADGIVVVVSVVGAGDTD